MPGTAPERLCPICDSPIGSGSKKCSFCGTDLSIFEGEIEEALKEEERLVEKTFSELEPDSDADLLAEDETKLLQLEAEETTEKPIDEKPIEEKPSREVPKDVEVSEGVLYECPACGGKVSESDDTCPHCGAVFSTEEVAQFECPGCGTLVNADAIRCSGCGALFVEDESAADIPSVQVDAERVPPKQPSVAPKRAPAEPQIAVAPPVAKTEHDAMARTIAEAKRDRAVMSAGAAPAAPPAMKQEAPADEVKGRRKAFGFLKGLLSKDEAAVKEEPSPVAKLKPAPSPKARAAQPMRERKPPVARPEKPEVESAEMAMPLPSVEREIPKDPKEQGKELARLVAEVRALLAIAREREIDIDESKELIDNAIMAGRERRFVQALEIVSESEKKLYSQLSDYLSGELASLQEEIEIARRLGGSPSRAEAFVREAQRAAGTLGDFQASLVFIDKARNELRLVTGRYNDCRDAIRKFERLVKDIRYIGMDSEPLKPFVAEAKEAFEAMDFDTADELIRRETDKIVAQIPERLEHAIETTKQSLVEAKIRTEKSISPQVTILKSVISARKDGKYLDALAEMKRLKKDIKKLLSQT